MMAILGRLTVRQQQVAAGVTAVILLTVCLWASGVISTAFTLVAYGTSVLAAGTVALAGGTIGLFSQQREANRLLSYQADEIQRQLDRGRVSDMAQVTVRMLTGQGQRVRIEVVNGSRRAIRSVYVWADIDGVAGHYGTIVIEPYELVGQSVRSRRMQHMVRTIGGSELSQCYRSILPGEKRTFTQYAVTNPLPIPAGVADDWITAYVMFIDVEGIWWTCSEDGDVTRLAQEPPLLTSPRPAPVAPVAPKLPQRPPWDDELPLIPDAEAQPAQTTS